MIQEHEIVLYQVEDTNICVNVVFKDETFWMTQKAMAELFDVNVPAISKHLSNIFEEGELFKEATVSKMEIVMSYSRISPRLAISLLILIFLLIPFRQSCRIGYNVRDQLQIAHIVAKVVLFKPLRFLYCLVLIPDHARVISSVRIAYSLPFCTPCLRHSSVNSLRMRIASSR